MTEPRLDERALLDAGSRELGLPLEDRQVDDLVAYLDQIYTWNKAAGLTTIRRPDAVRLHVLDSLAASPLVPRGPCIDLGTGAGLPGFVLAIVRPELHVVLVESNRKKCSFLLETATKLGLRNVEVVQTDIAQLPAGRLYPVVISRAFRPPEEFVRIAGPLVEPGGRVVLMMAEPEPELLARLEQRRSLTVTRVDRLILPGGKEARTIAALDFRA